MSKLDKFLKNYLWKKYFYDNYEFFKTTEVKISYYCISIY